MLTSYWLPQISTLNSQDFLPTIKIQKYPLNNQGAQIVSALMNSFLNWVVVAHTLITALGRPIYKKSSKTGSKAIEKPGLEKQKQQQQKLFSTCKHYHCKGIKYEPQIHETPVLKQTYIQLPKFSSYLNCTHFVTVQTVTMICFQMSVRP